LASRFLNTVLLNKMQKVIFFLHVWQRIETFQLLLHKIQNLRYWSVLAVLIFNFLDYLLFIFILTTFHPKKFQKNKYFTYESRWSKPLQPTEKKWKNRCDVQSCLNYSILLTLFYCEKERKFKNNEEWKIIYEEIDFGGQDSFEFFGK